MGETLETPGEIVEIQKKHAETPQKTVGNGQETGEM